MPKLKDSRSILRRALERVCVMPPLANPVLIGTYHKSGTVWMESLFQSLASALRLNYDSSSELTRPTMSRCHIFQQNHASFDLNAFPTSYRGLHLVRDPRDMLVSATFYHRRSDEAWLFEPRASLNGQSVREKVVQLASFDEELLLSMELLSMDFANMARFDYTDPQFKTVRYEELIVDHQLELFESIFHFLGFGRQVLHKCLVYAYRNSLFSRPPKTNHVRSGKPLQWPEYFKPVHQERFEHRFPNILDRAGYEPRWELMSGAQSPEP